MHRGFLNRVRKFDSCRGHSPHERHARLLGDNTYGQSSPPTGTFREVSAGGSHMCAIGTNAKVACWGSNQSGQSAVFGGNSR